MKGQKLKLTFSLLQVFATFSLRSKLLVLANTTRSKFKQETQQVLDNWQPIQLFQLLFQIQY
jgi:hypothetical protein